MFLPPLLHAQQSSGGASTAGAHAPVHDAENRPITAGGTVDKGRVVFQDISGQAGLTAWKYRGGTPAKALIVESLGGGVGLLDYDNDGWLDIYLVNGMTYDALSGKAPAPHAALFHNNHDGTFTNVAAKAGVTNDRWGVGVAVGDYDNDGWPDLYVTNVGKNRLYHNNHDNTFTDLAESAGVALGAWSTGPTFGDYDGDGKLDLFVPATPCMTSTIRQQQARNGWFPTSASSVESTSSVGRAGSRENTIISSTTTATEASPMSASKQEWPTNPATLGSPLCSQISTATAVPSCWSPMTLPQTISTATREMERLKT
jgi:hypothetical protein